MRLETCLSKDFSTGIHFLSAPCGLLTPGTIDPCDIERLLFAAGSEGDFDEIVLAADLSMFHLIPVLLEKASRVLRPLPIPHLRRSGWKGFSRSWIRGTAAPEGLRKAQADPGKHLPF